MQSFALASGFSKCDLITEGEKGRKEMFLVNDTFNTFYLMVTRTF